MLGLIDERDARIASQYFAKVSIQLFQSRCRINTPKNPCEEWGFGRREAMPNYRFRLRRRIFGVGLEVFHVSATDPKREGLELTHDAPAPILREDVGNRVTALLKTRPEPVSQLPAISPRIGFFILRRIDAEASF